MLCFRIALALVGALAGTAGGTCWGQANPRFVEDNLSCAGLSPDSFEPNDTCVDPAPIGRGLFTNLNVAENDWDTFLVLVPHGYRLTVQEELDVLDRVSFVYSEPNCGVYLTSGAHGLDWRNDTGRAIEGVLEVRRLPHAIVHCSEYAMRIEVQPDPCYVAADDALEPNDDCDDAIWITDGTYPAQFVSRYDPDHFRFCVAAGATLSASLLFDNERGDLDAYLRPVFAATCGIGPGGDVLAQATSGTHNEYLHWTNQTGSALDVVLEVHVWESSAQACNGYDLVVAGTGSCTGSETGMAFCAPMDPNSTGASTTLRGHLGSGTGSGLRLTAFDGPPQQFGYVLVGSATQFPGLTVGEGRLCLATSSPAQLGRYDVYGDRRNSVGLFNAAGVWVNQVGTSNNGQGFDVPSWLPLPGSPGIQAGQTWHFQIWHRDAGGQANFSNGLTVAF